MSTYTQSIPKAFIYEMVDGQPIYYRGYKKFLQGNENVEKFMGSSVLQSLIISRLLFFLQSNIGAAYEVLTNEVGVQFDNKSWRAADIAVVKKTDLKQMQTFSKYLDFPPEIVIEIDTKAALEEVQNPLGYYHKKTDELLDFGVGMVVWIFTDSEKVMLAQPDKKWETFSWEMSFLLFENIEVSVQALLET